MSGGDVPEPINEFTRDIIPDCLFQNILRCNYKRPTPVQKYGMAIGMANRDLMACAQTGTSSSSASPPGSGKTAGFLFPIIAAMLRDGPSKAPLPDTGYTDKYVPTCLILSPTRELASQIHKEAQRVGVVIPTHPQFCYCTGIAAAVVYGGIPMRETTMSLRRGCDILVGTPGRVLDLLQRDYIGLEGITSCRCVWCDG